MSMKEEFMKLKSYEEFDSRRNEFKGLKTDQDVVAHMGKIFPKLASNGINKDGTIEELKKEPSK